MTTIRRHPGFRQRGIVSIIAAIILIAVVIFVLGQTFGVIGNTSRSNESQVDSVAAFFVAESGAERAQATIKMALDSDIYNATFCTTPGNWPEQSLGSGKTFQYTPAPTCSGINCTECNVTIKGTANSAARTIRVKISATNTQGDAQCGSTPTLNLSKPAGFAAVFTNMASRAKDDGTMCGPGGGSSAVIGTCTVNFSGVVQSNCNPTVEGWNIESTGTNAISDIGVFTSVPTPAGSYTIQETLETNSGNPAPRNYVQTGVYFGPFAAGVPVTRTGTYAEKTGTDKTQSASGTSGSVPSNWNCAPKKLNGDNDTATDTNAADADTLVYGFGSWPQSGTPLTSVTIGPLSLPMRLQLAMTSPFPDNIYSHIWYLYNPSYNPNPGGTPLAASGASFTATVGAIAKGYIAGTLLTITDISGTGLGGVIRAGDTISGPGVTPSVISFGGTGIGGTGTYTVSNSQTVGSSPPPPSNAVTFTITSSVLRVTSGTTLTVGDSILSGGLAASPPLKIGALLAPGYYRLRNSTDTSDFIVSSPLISGVGTSMTTGNTRIALTNAVNTPPETSTGVKSTPALALISGLGAFPSSAFSGSLNDKTLSLSSPATLCEGDMLFGSTVKQNTTITSAAGTVTPGACVTGQTFTVSKSHPITTGDQMVARTAVVTWNSTNDITVSRPVFLSGAAICGGICAVLAKGSSTNFTLAPSSLAGDDWASGFACLSGVDPESIRNLGVVAAKKTGWTELVQE